MRQKRKTPGHRRLLQLLIDGRVESGLTQTELADRLQVRQSYVSNYETGERRLDVVEFLLVCQAVGLDPAVVVKQVAEVVSEKPPEVTRAPSAKRKDERARKGPRKRRAL